MKARQIAAAALVTIGLVLSALAPAHAGTQRQFNDIQTGWTKTHTQDYINDHGALYGYYNGSAGNRHMVRYYTITDTGHTEWIDYRETDTWRVFDMYGDQARAAIDAA